jgi:heterodisulfide reductase subunit A
MIQCVGSRDEEHPHCSRICCAAALKNVIRLQEMNPQVRILVFYRDLRAFGTLERHYRKAREAGAVFVWFDPKDPPVVGMEDGELTLTALDPVVGVRVRFRPDRVILSTGVVARVPPELLDGLGIHPDPEGFLPEANAKFRPLDLQEGVYGCGLALGPAFLGEAMAQGRGAAMRAAAFLQVMKRAVPEQGARVQGARCSACGLCVASCPFDARELDEEEGHAVVHAELCQACGTCAAVCPNDASQLVGYSDRQVLSAIDALLEA